MYLLQYPNTNLNYLIPNLVAAVGTTVIINKGYDNVKDKYATGLQTNEALSQLYFHNLHYSGDV